MSTLSLETNLSLSRPRATTLLLFCAATLGAMGFTAILDAIVFYNWPLGLHEVPRAHPGPLILATSILVQPLTLALRTGLVALVAQALLLVVGESVGFRLLFRAALLAGFAMLAQVFLALVPIIQYGDLAHVNLVPGSLGTLFPSLSASPVWSPLARQASLLELAWLAIFYTRLRAYTQIGRGKLATAVLGTWILAVLAGWVLGLLPYLLGITPPTA